MAEIYDLRSFLDVLTQHGQLSRISKPVSIIHEAADVGATIERTGVAAPLFEHIYDEEVGEVQKVEKVLNVLNVMNLPNLNNLPNVPNVPTLRTEFTGWQLFSSAVANQERVALALGCNKEQVTAKMAFALEPANAIKPVLIENAPCVFVISEACAIRLVAPRVTLSANASHGHKPTARNAT